MPDRTVKTFALKIDAENFNGFIAKMLRAGDGGQVDKKFFVEVTSAQIEESKLLETFGLEFSKDTDKKFCYPAPRESAAEKKFNSAFVAAGALIIVILLAIWYFMPHE